jgi:hypothetical protein
VAIVSGTLVIRFGSFVASFPVGCFFSSRSIRWESVPQSVDRSQHTYWPIDSGTPTPLANSTVFFSCRSGYHCQCSSSRNHQSSSSLGLLFIPDSHGRYRCSSISMLAWPTTPVLHSFTEHPSSSSSPKLNVGHSLVASLVIRIGCRVALSVVFVLLWLLLLWSFVQSRSVQFILIPNQSIRTVDRTVFRTVLVPDSLNNRPSRST